jgi:hypothetical protein
MGRDLVQFYFTRGTSHMMETAQTVPKKVHMGSMLKNEAGREKYHQIKL